MRYPFGKCFGKCGGRPLWVSPTTSTGKAEMPRSQGCPGMAHPDIVAYGRTSKAVFPGIALKFLDVEKILVGIIIEKWPVRTPDPLPMPPPPLPYQP